MPWITTLGLLLSLFVGQAQPQLTYEQALNQGLKAEGLRQWPEAISFYVQAIKLQPQNPLPRDRLISVFRDLKSQGQSTTELEILLPEDIKFQLSKLGAIETAADQAASLRRMNIIFWSVAAFIVLAILGGLLWLFLRQRRDDEDEPKFSTRVSPKKKGPGTEASKTTGETPRKDLVVTERTREQMKDVIAGVKSIPLPSKASEPVTAEQMNDLKESEVLSALAQTMISEVETEETDLGRFSKMTIEAQLIFDDEKKS